MTKKHLSISSIVIIAALVLVVSVPASQVHAVSTTTLMQKAENRASQAAERQTTLLTRFIQRADQLITTRLDSLQKLLSRVQSDKRLPDADKASLTNDIQTTVGSLQTLKAKVDADTDETTARADAKSVITSYKIYAMYEPKIRILTTISNLQTTATNVSSLSAQVQTFLTVLKSEGKDTTTAQNAITDITTQLTAINTALSTDKTLLSNININTTNPQSVFVQIRKDLATVRSEFAKIRNDIATLRSSFKAQAILSPTAATSSAK